MAAKSRPIKASRYSKSKIAAISRRNSSIYLNDFGFSFLLLQNKPFFYYADDDESTPPLGLIPDLLKTMGEKMGFEYEFVLPEDKKYGSYDEETNTWNGMIGGVLSGVSEVKSGENCVASGFPIWEKKCRGRNKL